MKKKIVTILTALLLLMVPVIPAMAVEELPSGTSNIDANFFAIDGGMISTQSNGKPKLLVFFKVGCGNCINTLSTISKSDWLKNGEVEVCAIECEFQTDDVIRNFRDTYCSEAGGMIQFGKCHYGDADAYLQKTGAPASSFSATPLVAMIDVNNNLCYVHQGNLPADDIEDYIPTLQASSGSNSGSGSGSGSGDSQKPGSSTDSKKDKKDKKSTDSKPGCDHVAEYFTINDATSSDDALSAYQCIKCGAVLRYEAVPNSAYATFLADTANAILNAGQGEVTINTDIWTCFNRAVFDAIKSRPDVAVTVNYSYKGEPYVLHIPAGTNVDSLMDENGFGGFMYIQHVINTSK